MSYRHWTTLTIPLILFLYFVVGLTTKRTGEIYPFYHWGLFAVVSNLTTLAEVYLEEVDERRYTPPIRLQDTEEYKRLVMSDYDIYNSPRVLRRLASAYAEKRYARAAQLERVFEENFLVGDRVRYTLVMVTFDPLERFRTGRVKHREILGNFVKGEAEGERATRR